MSMAATDKQWLDDLFEFEDCKECGTGAEGHIVASDPFGNRHAWCSAEDLQLVIVPNSRLTLLQLRMDELNKCEECCTVLSCDVCGPCERHDLPS